MESDHISLLQMNILAKSLCDSKAFPFVKENCLDWNLRIKMLNSLFSSTEANKDFYCLEEVDCNDELKNMFSSNYQNIYYSKDKSSAPGGQSIYYNSNKFELISESKVSLSNDNQGTTGSQFALIAIFKNIKTNYILILTVVHLKAKADYEEVRYYQIKSLIEHITKIRKDMNIDNFIICGDFNAKPSEKVITILEENNDIYSIFDYSNDAFTSVKQRDKLYCYNIDYIFVSKNIKCISKHKALEDLTIDELSKHNYLPCDYYPSDHLYLCCNLTV